MPVAFEKNPQSFLVHSSVLLFHIFSDMLLSGVPKANGILHAGEVASIAPDLVAGCKTFEIPHKPNVQLKICAGIHSGEARQEVWRALSVPLPEPQDTSVFRGGNMTPSMQTRKE